MTATTIAPAEPDLAPEGIHRDPTNHDPIGGTSLSQRLVAKASSLLSRRDRNRTDEPEGHTRRSFLTRTAVVGSALAIGPIDFLMKPGSAYAYTCGTCSDGWTAFCCTINGGRNTCPAGSFIAGWWKADNAAYCCGAARYIIDCNATCPTQCACRCAGGSCDGRRTCCNQFRYGQCNTQIACYGPVVCRVATCTVPWEYDPSCTRSSATDNRTVNHGAPCLSTDCGTAISKRYDQLGGANGVLGKIVVPESANSDGRGRRARYENGNIYWTSTTGAREVYGRILEEFSRNAGVNGPLKYPKTYPRRSNDDRSTFQDFENGRIYDRGSAGIFTVLRPWFTKHEEFGGVHGVIGYPIRNVTTSSDRRSRYQNFERGRIYVIDGNRTVEIHGAVYTHHESIAGVYGPLGYPMTDLDPVGDGRGKAQWFEKGLVWYTATTGAWGLWGKILSRYVANGHVRGYIRYPTSSPTPVGDGRGTVATFERGNIYESTTTEAFQVHGAVLREYLDTYGGPTGSLGYPLSELDPAGTPGGRFQEFEGGTLQYIDDSNVPLVP